MVSAGQTATATVTVTESNIAKTMKSGSLGGLCYTSYVCSYGRGSQAQYNLI